jgi:hypothetical protein
MSPPSLLLLISPRTSATSICGSSTSKILLVSVLIASFFQTMTRAVTLGFEQYGNLDGYFYCVTVFGTVEIVDPKRQAVVNSINVGTGSNFSWGDTVYIRDQGNYLANHCMQSS